MKIDVRYLSELFLKESSIKEIHRMCSIEVYENSTDRWHDIVLEIKSGLGIEFSRVIRSLKPISNGKEAMIAFRKHLKNERERILKETIDIILLRGVLKTEEMNTEFYSYKLDGLLDKPKKEYPEYWKIKGKK
jgi:hypothetical protein